MKNISTKYFCRRFNACPEGTRFARRYDTMRDCYDDLLDGEAGKDSAEWAVWGATREGVMSDRNLRLFAVKCARRVQHLMKDKRSIEALDVAERYANGDATKEELDIAWNTAWAVPDAPSHDTKWAARSSSRSAAWAARPTARPSAWASSEDAALSAARAAMSASVDAAWDAYDAAWVTERMAQLDILKEFGNPFEEEGAEE